MAKRRLRRGELADAVDEGEQVGRRRASREVGYALRTIQAMRHLYLASAALVAVLLVAVVLLSPRESGWLPFAGGLAATLALLLIGARTLMQRPVVWTVVIATFMSLLVGIMALDGLRTPLEWWGRAIAFALWFTVPLAVRAKRLIERYPDLYIAQRWKGTREAPEESALGRRLRERQAAARQRRRRLLLFGGGAVALAVVAFGVLPGLLREDPPPPEPPPPIGPAAAGFRSAWNRSAFEELAGFIDPATREPRFARIRRILARRGWGEALPALGQPRVTDRGGRARTVYPLAEDASRTLEVRWEVREGRWRWYASKWPSRD